MYFSKNTSEVLARSLSQISGFTTTKDLGKYLGVPVLHRRVTKQTYKNILDKLHQKLATWKGSNLSLAERITLCNDPDSLWASVLRGELLYVKTQDWNQQIQGKKKESALWKAICKVWPQAIAGVGWSIGNGRKIRFWKDDWLDGYEPLIQHVSEEISDIESEVTMACMVTPSKQWKWECFAHLISMQIVMVLASYPVPLSETEEDVLEKLS